MPSPTFTRRPNQSQSAGTRDSPGSATGYTSRLSTFSRSVARARQEAPVSGEGGRRPHAMHSTITRDTAAAQERSRSAWSIWDKKAQSVIAGVEMHPSS